MSEGLLNNHIRAVHIQLIMDVLGCGVEQFMDESTAKELVSYLFFSGYVSK